ncbi:MAG: PD-(D/E)XK nuclease family protein, partial [Methanosarcina sp.]
LRQMELRGGLACDCLPDPERQSKYYSAVKSVIAGTPDCLFRKSFAIDEYGVAAELLKWRDELVAAGWDHSLTGISKKLDFLSAVEKEAINSRHNIKGESDRWRNVINHNGSFISEEDEIIVHFPRKLVPPHIDSLLTKIENSGTRVSESFPKEGIAPEGTNLRKIQDALLNAGLKTGLNASDNSFRVVRFDSNLSALEWAASCKNSSDAIFVNNDNCCFDSMQVLFGDPESGSSLVKANPFTVQLFKLGCSLFIRPLNIYNLLSYLQINPHPLDYSLRKDLIKVILDEGGIINPAWTRVLDDHFAKNDKKEKEEVLRFLPVGDSDSDTVYSDELRKFTLSLRNWASQRMIIINASTPAKNADDGQITRNDSFTCEQLSAMVTFCNALLIILNDQAEDKIPVDRLRSWILSIYQPENYSGKEPCESSRFVIASPAAFADHAEKVVWLDCFGQLPSPSACRFLDTQERITLKERNVLIWSSENNAEANLMEQKAAILNCTKECTLVLPSRDRGSRLESHPVIIQLMAQFPDLHMLEINNPDPEGEMKILEKRIPNEVPDGIRMEEANLFKPRQKESYSSVSALIQNPLDYVLTYQAGLSFNSISELADKQRTMGNVAHLFIEQLINDSGKDISRMRELSVNDFSHRFSNAVLQKGAILLLDENKILCIRFSGILEKSVQNLIRIIENNKLSISGCEVTEACRPAGFPEMEARIDLLLADCNGSPVIFDLKWSASPKRYYRMIRENKALQLEFYKKILESSADKKKVIAVGYFNIMTGRLETSYQFSDTENINVIDPENTNDIFNQARKSWEYRWKQLNDEGFIEIAEEHATDTILYCQDSEEKDLYPLETDSRNAIKRSNNYSRFRTLKGGLK